MIQLGWFTGIIPLLTIFICLVVIIIIVNIINNRIYKKRLKICMIWLKRILVYIGCLAIIGIGIIITVHCYLGPQLPNHAELGYYAHKRPKAINVSKSYERNAVNRIYVTKNNIQWKHGIYKNHKMYYFPYNMPNHTRRYVVNHNK